MSTNSAAPNPKQMLFPPGNIHRKSSKVKVKLGPSYSVSAIWEYIICSVLNLYCMQKCQHPCGWRPGQDNHFKFKNKPPQTPLLCNLFRTKDNNNNKTTASKKMISASSRNVGALLKCHNLPFLHLFGPCEFKTACGLVKVYGRLVVWEDCKHSITTTINLGGSTNATPVCYFNFVVHQFIRRAGPLWMQSCQNISTDVISDHTGDTHSFQHFVFAFKFCLCISSSKIPSI